MALIEEMEKQGLWLFRYRGVLPLIILLAGTVLYLRTEIYPGTFLLEETPYEIYYESFCLVVSLLGLAIRIYTVGYTPKNTSGRNVDGQVADTLNKKGIYSVVRHPLYLGNLLMWTGPALMTANFLFVAAFWLLFWVYYERIMFAEEQFLKKKFGEKYTEWAAGVPAFIPCFRNYIRNDLPFSWKKVLKKEKNGFAAIFLIFALFDISGELIGQKGEFNYFVITMAAVSVLLYIVLKYLKRRTAILDEEGR